MNYRRALVVAGIIAALIVALAILFFTSISAHSGVAVPARGALVENVTIVNPGGVRVAGRTIECAGDRIARISPSSPNGTSGTGSKTIRGGYALPGLTDMHVHYPPDLPGDQFELFCFLFLAHGVTSTRDMGSIDRSICGKRREVTNGKYPGPRIYTPVTFIDGKDPMWPGSFVALTPAQGRAAVADAVRLGADFIKVYDTLAEDVLSAIVGEARKRGKRAVGHVPFGMRLEDTGIDDVQHLFGVPAPLPGKGGHASRQVAWHAFNDARLAHVVKWSVSHGMAHTPTLVVLHRLGMYDDYHAMRNGPAGALMPRYYRDVIWHPRDGIPFLRKLTAIAFQDLRDTEPLRFRTAKALFDGGARIHAGTDVQTPFVVPGASLHEEFKLLMQAGIPLEAIWRIATRGAGEYLGTPGLGVIAEGSPADIVIYGEDPTKDFAAFGTLKAVIADGRLYSREDLDRGLARYRARFNEPLFDSLSMLMARLAMFFIF